MADPDRVIWEKVLSHLRAHEPEVCRQWFEEIEPIGVADGVFRLRVPQEVHRNYLEKHCSDAFNAAIQGVTERLLTVRFLGLNEAVAPMSAPSMNGKERRAPVVPATTSASLPEWRQTLAISPDHTFENFIVGPENQMAFSVAIAVSEAPGKEYNPMFVYGGVGLGKTHLLQAICIEMLTHNPQAKIHYTSFEAFSTQMMAAIQAKELADFRHRFDHLDLLVIDDIQFLTGRDRTQEEFFHIFNNLYQSDRHVVVSSDVPPSEIPDLEERLVNRFQSGLIIDVRPPSFETRIQITKKKAELRGMTMPDEAFQLIASKVQRNVREIEGALTSIQLVRRVTGGDITMDLVRQALGEQIREIKPQVTITQLIDSVTGFYNVKLTDLQSERRHKSIAFPRQVAMYLLRQHTRYSLQEIGGYFGGRDHTTVMHAVRTIATKRTQDQNLERFIESVEHRYGLNGA